MHHKKIIFHMQANGVVEELCANMDTKVRYISKNTALMNR